MSLEAELWTGRYSQESFPSFPCPRCRSGRLALQDDSFKVNEPLYSLDGRENILAWEPDWTVQRFVGFLVCGNRNCGEISTISGDVEYEEVPQNHDEWTWKAVLVPRSIFPPPPIIRLPGAAPNDVVSQLKLAFQCFWSDFGASANHLRTSVERLLDHAGVPRGTRCNLRTRISKYQEINEEHAEAMDALRIVGNVGSHQDGITRQALLDAFEIYEYTLSNIYERRSEAIGALRRKIIETQGKYKA